MGNQHADQDDKVEIYGYHRPPLEFARCKLFSRSFREAFAATIFLHSAW